LPDDVKRARVEELMLTQQKVAFAKTKSMIGQTTTVLVDRPAGRDAEDGWVGRTTSQAPDIDSATMLRGEGFHAGQLVEVKITGAEGYDLTAELPKKKSRGLKVVSR